MNFELVVFREDIFFESNKLLNIMKPHFTKRMIGSVIFDFENESKTLTTNIYYSEDGFWSARFKNQDNLIHVFGKSDINELLK